MKETTTVNQANTRSSHLDRRDTQFLRQATGKDETSLRQQLTNQKCEELRRSRDHWKTRAEKEERFQKTKEDAWSLFERQLGIKRKTKEEFEEEFKRKVRDVMSSSRSERDKMLQKWSSEMQKVVQPEERRREARERGRKEQEDPNSQRPRSWEKTRGLRIPVPSPHRSPQWRLKFTLVGAVAGTSVEEMESSSRKRLLPKVRCSSPPST